MGQATHNESAFVPGQTAARRVGRSVTKHWAATKDRETPRSLLESPSVAVVPRAFDIPTGVYM